MCDFLECLTKRIGEREELQTFRAPVFSLMAATRPRAITGNNNSTSNLYPVPTDPNLVPVKGGTFTLGSDHYKWSSLPEWDRLDRSDIMPNEPVNDFYLCAHASVQHWLPVLSRLGPLILI